MGTLPLINEPDAALGATAEDKKRILLEHGGELRYQPVMKSFTLLGSKFFNEFQTGLGVWASFASLKSPAQRGRSFVITESEKGGLGTRPVTKRNAADLTSLKVSCNVCSQLLHDSIPSCGSSSPPGWRAQPKTVNERSRLSIPFNNNGSPMIAASKNIKLLFVIIREQNVVDPHAHDWLTPLPASCVHNLEEEQSLAAQSHRLKRKNHLSWQQGRPSWQHYAPPFRRTNARRE